MFKLYDRGSNQLIKIRSSSSIQELDKNTVLETLGVQSIIRIPDREYPESSQPGALLTHFGLPIYDTKPHMVGILARILRNGQVSKGAENPPVLSFENVWLAEIEKVINRLELDKVPSSYLENVIGNIVDHQSLKETILDRYREVLSSLDTEQILSQGVSVRFLRLRKKVSFFNS